MTKKNVIIGLFLLGFFYLVFREMNQTKEGFWNFFGTNRPFWRRRYRYGYKVHPYHYTYPYTYYGRPYTYSYYPRYYRKNTYTYF